MGIINQPSRILQVTHLVKWGYIHGLCSHGATATNDEETALDEHVLATISGIACLWPVFAPSQLQCWAAKRWKIEDLSDPMNKILEVYPVKPQKFASDYSEWCFERHGGYWALIIQHPFFQNMICKWFYIPLPHLLLRYLLRGQVVTPAPASAWIRIVTSVPAHGQGWRWGAGLG